MPDGVAESATAPEGGQQSAEQPVVEQGKPEVVKPSVKPIPPEREAEQRKAREDRPTLPGLVHDRNDVLDEVLAPRDPKTGRFMSREQIDALSERELLGLDDPEDDDRVVQRKESAPPLPNSDANTQKPKGAKFVFDGEEYESEEAFKQNIKSLRGQYKSFEANRQKLIKDRDFGYEAGWKWKAESDKKDEIIKALEQRLAGQTPAASGGGNQPNGTNQSQGQSNPATGADFDVDQILTDDVGREFERLTITQGLPHAGKFLVQSTLKTVVEKLVPALRAELRQEIQPLQQNASDQQAFEGVQQTIRQVSAMKTESGELAFPEASDSNVIARVAQMWVDSGHPRETAFTVHGFITAISLYRVMTGFGNKPVVIPKQPQSQPNANAAAPAASLDASGELNARPLQPKGSENLSPGARALVEAFRMDEPMIDPILGFARNKKR